MNNLQTIIKEFHSSKSIQRCCSPLQRFVEEWSQDLERSSYGISPFYALPLQGAYETGTNVSFAHLKGKDAALVRFLASCKQLLMFLVTRRDSGNELDQSPNINSQTLPFGFNQSLFPYSNKEDIIENKACEDRKPILVILNSLDKEIHLPSLASNFSTSMASRESNFANRKRKIVSSEEERAIIICPKGFFFNYLLAKSIPDALGYLSASIREDAVKKIYSIGEMKVQLIRVFIQIHSDSSVPLLEEIVPELFDISIALQNTNYMRHILAIISRISNSKTRKTLLKLIGFVPVQDWIIAVRERIIPSCFDNYDQIYEATELVKELLVHRTFVEVGLILIQVIINRLFARGPPSINRGGGFYQEWICHHPLLINITKLLVYSQDTSNLEILKDLLINYGNDFSPVCPLSLLLKGPELWEMFLLTMGTVATAPSHFKHELNQWIVHMLKARILKLMAFPRPDTQQPYRFQHVTLEEINDLSVLEFLRSDEEMKTFSFSHVEDAQFLTMRLNGWKEGKSNYSVIGSLKTDGRRYIVEIQKTLHYFHSSICIAASCDEDIQDFEEKLAHPALALFDLEPSCKMRPLSKPLSLTLIVSDNIDEIPEQDIYSPNAISDMVVDFLFSC